MGVATLGGVPLRIDPDSVSWDYSMKVSDRKTVGGRVVQVYGVRLGDMVVSGVFGSGDRARGDSAGWEEQERFRGQVERWAQDAQREQGRTPLRFLYAPRRWDFQVFVKDYSGGGTQRQSVVHSNAIINPGWSLTLFIVDDRSRVVVKGIQDLYIRRLMDGVGWRQTRYNGPSQKDVDELLSGRSPMEYIRDEFIKATGIAGTGPAPGPGQVGGATPPPGRYGGTDLSAVQLKNAVTIINTGAGRGATELDHVVALATALQESGLKNLASSAVPESLQYPNDGVAPGDHDSVGLFQQRTSTGWGTVQEIMQPAHSAGRFYEALLKIGDRASKPVTVQAQEVQRSAFPDAYAKWEDEARAVVAATKAAAAGGAGGPAGGSGGWVPPMAPGSYRVGSPYGMRTHPVTGQQKMHTGQDMGAATGTPIHAVASGRVAFAGDSGGYGRLVKLDHGGGVQSWYAHQSSIAARVGDQVAAGDRIGFVGSTGMSTGPHLHLEVRVNGSHTDPVAYLSSRGARL